MPSSRATEALDQGLQTWILLFFRHGGTVDSRTLWRFQLRIEALQCISSTRPHLALWCLLLLILLNVPKPATTGTIVTRWVLVPLRGPLMLQWHLEVPHLELLLHVGRQQLDQAQPEWDPQGPPKWTTRNWDFWGILCNGHHPFYNQLRIRNKECHCSPCCIQLHHEHRNGLHYTVREGGNIWKLVAPWAPGGHSLLLQVLWRPESTSLYNPNAEVRILPPQRGRVRSHNAIRLPFGTNDPSCTGNPSRYPRPPWKCCQEGMACKHLQWMVLLYREMCLSGTSGMLHLCQSSPPGTGTVHLVKTSEEWHATMILQGLCTGSRCNGQSWCTAMCLATPHVATCLQLRCCSSTALRISPEESSWKTHHGGRLFGNGLLCSFLRMTRIGFSSEDWTPPKCGWHPGPSSATTGTMRKANLWSSNHRPLQQGCPNSALCLWGCSWMPWSCLNSGMRST